MNYPENLLFIYAMYKDIDQGHVIRSLWTVINAALSLSCSALRRVLIFRSGVSLLLIFNVDGLVYFIVGISCSAANMTGMSQISSAEAF